MEERIAVISIILLDNSKAKEINEILTSFADKIIGRMGLPYKEKKINIICIVLDAKEDVINNLSGRLGKIRDVSVKANYVSKNKL